MRSFVRNIFTMNSHAKFHLDECLSKVSGSDRFRINLWCELITSGERNEYQAALALE